MHGVLDYYRRALRVVFEGAACRASAGDYPGSEHAPVASDQYTTTAIRVAVFALWDIECATSKNVWQPALHVRLAGASMVAMNYEIEPHQIIACRTFPQGVCVKCGLVCLNNDFTRWALRVGCNNVDHPSFHRYRAATNPFEVKR